MVINKYVFLFLVFCLISCGEKKDGFLYNEVDIVGQILQNDLILKSPRAIELINNDIILFAPEPSNVLFFVDKDNLNLKNAWGNYGQGPGEFNYPNFAGINRKNSELYIYDQLYQVLREYKISGEGELDLIKEKRYSNDTVFITHLHRLDNGYSVASVLSGTNSPAVLLNQELNIVKGFGSLKDQPEECNNMACCMIKISELY